MMQTYILSYIHTCIHFPYIKNCSIAVGTSGCKHLLVVSFTVRLAVVTIERTRGQLLVALDAGKVLNMPWPVHRSDHLSQNWFITGGAGAFRLRVHPSLTDILLQLTQHTVQLCETLLLVLCLRRGIGTHYRLLGWSREDFEVSQGCHETVQFLCHGLLASRGRGTGNASRWFKWLYRCDTAGLWYGALTSWLWWWRSHYTKCNPQSYILYSLITLYVPPYSENQHSLYLWFRSFSGL